MRSSCWVCMLRPQQACGCRNRRLATVATISCQSFLAGFGDRTDVLTGTIEQGWPAFLLLSVDSARLAWW
jgi:hypothetical protein